MFPNLISRRTLHSPQPSKTRIPYRCASWGSRLIYGNGCPNQGAIRLPLSGKSELYLVVKEGDRPRPKGQDVINVTFHQLFSSKPDEIVCWRKRIRLIRLKGVAVPRCNVVCKICDGLPTTFIGIVATNDARATFRNRVAERKSYRKISQRNPSQVPECNRVGERR